MVVEAADRYRAAGLSRHLELDGFGALQSEPAALRLRLLGERRGTFLLVVRVHGARHVGSPHLAAAPRRPPPPPRAPPPTPRPRSGPAPAAARRPAISHRKTRPWRAGTGAR